MKRLVAWIGICALLIAIAVWYWRHEIYCPSRNNCEETSSYRITIPVAAGGGENGVAFAPAQSSEETGEDATFPTGPASFDVTDKGLLALADPLNSRVMILDIRNKVQSSQQDAEKPEILGYIHTAFSPARARVRSNELLIQRYYDPSDNDSICDLSDYRETKTARCDSIGLDAETTGKSEELRKKQKAIVEASDAHLSVIDLIEDPKSLVSFRFIGTDRDGHQFVLVHPKMKDGMTAGPFFVRKYSAKGIRMATSPGLFDDGDIDPYDDARVDSSGTVYWLTVRQEQVGVQIWRTHAD
jgi:hypothetical protein